MFQKEGRIQNVGHMTYIVVGRLGWGSHASGPILLACLGQLVGVCIRVYMTHLDKIYLSNQNK